MFRDGDEENWNTNFLRKENEEEVKKEAEIKKELTSNKEKGMNNKKEGNIYRVVEVKKMEIQIFNNGIGWVRSKERRK